MIKIDPTFNVMAQVDARIQRSMGNSVASDFNGYRAGRVDFEFDLSRQALARIQERNGLNLQRTSACVPTPREELNRFDPPLFRKDMTMFKKEPLFSQKDTGFGKESPISLEVPNKKNFFR